MLEAQGEARAEIEKRNTETALALGRELLDAAKAADKSLTAAFLAFAEMRDVARQLNLIGCAPNLNLVDINLKRALITASMGSGYALGHISPAERHTVAELGATWAANIQGWAMQRLEPQKQDEKVAA